MSNPPVAAPAAPLPPLAHVAAIRANVDRYYADAVTYEAFGDEQRKLWSAVDADGPAVRAEVLRLMRTTVAS